MNSFENSQQFEIIDNESKKINEKLDKMEENAAIDLLNRIDAKVPFDIDLAFDRENNKYYFIWNEKNSMNVALDFKELEEIWNVLVEALNKDVQLFWSLYGRSLAEDTWTPDGLEKKLIETTWSNFSKDDIEEIFVFIMKTKWIPMEDWKIEETVCANWAVNDECKQALGK